MELFPEDKGELWVLEGLDFGEGSSVLAPCSPVLFRCYTRHLVPDAAPARTTRARPRRRAATSKIREKLLDEYPWLTSADLDDVVEQPDDEQGKVEDSDHDASEPEVDEEQYERARQEILQLRAEYAVQDEDKFFYVRQRGGASNVARHGRALDCAAFFARSRAAPRYPDP